MEKFGYISIAQDELKERVLYIQNEIKKIIGDDPFFSQWPPHITISFGNILNNDELKEVVESFETIGLANKKIPFTFKDEFFMFALDSKWNPYKPRYAITLCTTPNTDLENLSSQVVSIAEKYSCPHEKIFKSLQKKEFHLTLLSSCDISEEQFEAIKNESKNWTVPTGGTIESLSIVKNGSDFSGYPVMESEYHRIELLK